MHRTPVVLPLRDAGCPPASPSPDTDVEGGSVPRTTDEAGVETSTASQLPVASAAPPTEKDAYLSFEKDTGELAKMALLRPSPQGALDPPHDPIVKTLMSALSLGLVSRQNEPTVTRHLEPAKGVDSTPTPANTKRSLTPPRAVLPPITPPPPAPFAVSADPPSDEDFEVKTLARHLFGDPREPRPPPADTGETATYKSEEETLARPVQAQNGEGEEEKNTLTRRLAREEAHEDVDTLSQASSPPPTPRDAVPPPPPSSTKGATAILDTNGGARKRASIAELAATTTPFPYPPLDPSPAPNAAIRTPLVMITTPEDNATRIQPMAGYPSHPPLNSPSLNQPIRDGSPRSGPPSYPPHSIPVRSSPIPFLSDSFRQATSNAAPIQKVAMFIIGTLLVAIVSFLVLRPPTHQHATHKHSNNSGDNGKSAANPTPVLMAPIDPPPGASPPLVVVPPVATTPPPPATMAAPPPVASTKPADPPKRRVVGRPIPRNIPVRREQ